MVNVVRPMQAWDRHATRPALLLEHDDRDWTFREVAYGPGGEWDVLSSCLHIAAHPDPLKQRLGRARAPLQCVPPSAAVSAAGDRLVGAWEGRGRGQHLTVSAGFVAAAFGHDASSTTVFRRHFAYQRTCDATDQILQNLLGALSVNLRAGGTNNAVFMQTVVLAAVQHAVQARAHVEATATGKSGLTKSQLNMVVETIDGHLAGRLSLLDLAALIGVSTRYFCRAFRTSTGLSPHQFIIRRRVERARSMIEAGQMSLGDIAHAAGFNDPSQMSTTFRKVLGAPPSHFRNGRLRMN